MMLGISHRSFLLLFLAIAITNERTYAESSPLKCLISIDGKAADCSYQRLSQPPLDLPSSIHYLDLSHNQLRGASLRRLCNLKKLRILKLKGNKIKQIPSDVMRCFGRLEYINLDNTQLLCDCNIIWLAKRLKAPDIKRQLVSYGKEIECHLKSSRKPVKLASLDASLLKHELNCIGEDVTNDSKAPKRQISKRSADVIFTFVAWSCSERSKVILIYNTTQTTRSSLLCQQLCNENSYDYVNLYSPTCTCYEQKNSAAYVINKCKYHCNNNKKGSCRLPRVDFTSEQLIVFSESGTGQSAAIVSSKANALSPSSTALISSAYRETPKVSSSSLLKYSQSSSKGMQALSVTDSTGKSVPLSLSTLRTIVANVSATMAGKGDAASSLVGLTPSASSATHKAQQPIYESHSQFMTPSYRKVPEEDGTSYYSPRTSFVPSTSHLTNYVPLTRAPAMNPEVTTKKHRSVRDVTSRLVSSKLEELDDKSKTLTTTSGAFTFTNASKHQILRLTVNISFTYSDTESYIGCFISNNIFSFIYGGVQIVDSNSIAAPENVLLNISSELIFAKKTAVSMVVAHNGVTTNLSSALLSRKDTAVFRSLTSLTSGMSGAFSYQLLFLNDVKDQMAALHINFTSVRPMESSPVDLVTLSPYVATFEEISLAFGTNYSFVEATWTLFTSGGSVVVSQNVSKCTESKCADASSPPSMPTSIGTSDGCTPAYPHSCILSKKYVLQTSTAYQIMVNFTNPVTMKYFGKTLSFTAERKISELTISSCDYKANLNMWKQFSLTYVGDILSVSWYVGDVRIASNVFWFNYTAKSLGNYTLAVFASNHLSNASTTANIDVFETGSIHGLKISSPAHGSFHPTLKPVEFLTQLCEGEDPSLNWNFGDGQNLTTGSTNCSHVFTVPRTYLVKLEASNSRKKIETQSVKIHLQDEIRDFRVSVNKSIVRVNELLLFAAKTSNGTDVLYSVSSKHAPSFVFNTSVAEGHPMSVAGNITLTVTAYNKVSSQIAYLQVLVQEVISLLLDHVIYKALNKRELFKASLISGTQMHSKWDFGDGEGTNWTYINSASPTASHIYTKEGSYNLILSVRNDVQSLFNRTSLVFVERSLSDVRFTSPSHVGTNESFLIDISTGEVSIYGYNVSVAGSTFLLRNRSHSIVKRYEKGGEYTLSLFAWNHVSNWSNESMITVQDRVSGNITISPMYVAQSATELVRIDAKVQGTDPKFTWHFSDDSPRTGAKIRRTFPHLGTFHFNVTAANEISSLTSQLIIFVQMNLDNLTLSANASYTPPNKTVFIKSSLAKRPEHVYSWQADGRSVDQNSDHILVSFRSIGHHPVTLTMNNNIGSTNATINITVLEPIRGLSVSLNENLTVIPFNESVMYYAQSTSGSDMTFTWCLQLACRATYHSTIVDKVTRLDIYYRNVTVIAKNQISEERETKLIPVVQRIRGVRITPSRTLSIVNTSVTFKVEYSSGSNVSTVWTINEKSVNSSGGQLAYMFTETGDYRVRVEAWNKVGKASSEVIVKIQRLFENLDVFPKSAVTNESTLFSATDLGVKDAMLEWIVPDGIESGLIKASNISLTFRRHGIYPLLIRASNAISKVNKTVYITVQDRVVGLGVSSNKIFYRSKMNETIVASLSRGSNVTYRWIFTPQPGSGASVYGNPREPRITFYLLNAGRYRVYVDAVNLVSSMSYAFEINVQDAAEILQLASKFVDVLPTNEDVTLHAVASGTNLRMTFSLKGDFVFARQFGRNLTCFMNKPGKISVHVTASNNISSSSRTFHYAVQDRVTNISLWTSATLVPVGRGVDLQVITQDGSDLSFAWLINGTYIPNETRSSMNRTFSIVGRHEMKVEARNRISFSASSVYIAVELPECDPPAIAISGGSNRTVLRSQWLHMESSIEYNCSTGSVMSSWSLRLAKANTNCKIERESLPLFKLTSDVSLQSTLLAIQPGVLIEGVYCLYYRASFGSKGRFRIHEAALLKVLVSPPVPVIAGGLMRAIGRSQPFVLDASCSIDPDKEQPTDLLFQWSCFAENGAAAAFNYSRFGCRNASWGGWSERRLLAIEAGSLVLGGLYRFALSVRKASMSPASTFQKVVIVKQKMPELLLACITCNVYKTSKFTANRDLKLLGTCKNCDTDFRRSTKLIMNWLVVSSSGSTVLNISKSKTEHEDLLIIKQNTLNKAESYTIQFSTTISDNITTVGSTQIALLPNEPPENGTCTVGPLEGVTLKTQFTIRCGGWMDNDNKNVPFIYWLRVESSTNSWDVLYRGIRPIFHVYLPVGGISNGRKIRVQALIEDTLGAQAIGLDSTVQVNPPNGESTKFLQDNVMSSLPLLTLENDLNKVVSVAQASARLLSDSGVKGTHVAGIVSSIAGNASKTSASSLEAVGQLSSALKLSVGLVKETDLKTEARATMTDSLERMINKAEVFASQGQLVDENSTNSLLYLVQNNIASETGHSGGGRERRASVSSSSHLRRNLNLAMKLYMSILRASIRGEDASVFVNKYGSTVLRRDKGRLLNTTFEAGGCSFVLNKTLGSYKDVFQIFNISHDDPFANPSTVVSKVAGLSFASPNGTEIAVKDLPETEAILVKLDRRSETSKLWGHKESKVIKARNSIEGEIRVAGLRTDTKMIIVEVFGNAGPTFNVDAFLREKATPDHDSIMHRLNISKYGTLMKHFRPGEFNTSKKYDIMLTNKDKLLDANVSVLVYSSSCVFWDRETLRWSSEGVAPTEKTTVGYAVCRSTHLTSFASTFKIAPNPIKWSTLSELDVEKNPIALAFCLTLIILYLIGAFFAARKDERDKQESHYIPMMGSDEFFKYEVRIKTGSFPGAGTTANVGVQISSCKGTTKSIVLAKQNSFQRNSVDFFRFASPTRLGKISRIRVWHDNTGSSPSWYLSRIVIKNLLNGQKYFFFCNRWLGVDRDDGEVERVFQVADAKMMAKFQTIFNDTIGRTFSDYHLWISIFEKPKLSRFTRVQRLTCCITFILSWMCIDAMWYGTVREDVDLYIGLKRYSYEEVIVGVISSLMVFPVNFMIVLIFRNCRLARPRQVLDGEDEVTIHVLSKSQRTRRLSEDWIEIEDISESHSLLGTSLPRCGGYFRLMSYNQSPYFADEFNGEFVEELSDRNDGETDDSDNPTDYVPNTHGSVVAYAQVSTKSSFMPKKPHYAKIPVCCEVNDGEDESAGYDIRKGSRCSTDCEEVTVSTTLAYSERNSASKDSMESRRSGRPYLPRKSSYERQVKRIHERYTSAIPERRSANVFPEIGRRPINSISKAVIRAQNLNDSLTSHITSSSAEGNFLYANSHYDQDFVDDEAVTANVPDIKELHPSLDCLLPHWFIGVAYFFCLAVSVLSFLIILMYGQQFGKDKALSWLLSVFSGLVQDIFVTYPALLVLVALFWALIRKPMNLDYSDFVTCPVIPGDPNADSEPVRGYALEIAQKQGRGKREVRRIVKNFFFQIVHLWIVFSICLTSYDAHMPTVKREFEAVMFPGRNGIQDINSIYKIWPWMETNLAETLYPRMAHRSDWVLRSHPRLRQIRIQSSDCLSEGTAKIVNNATACYPDFEFAHLENRDFASSWSTLRASTGTPWSFLSEEVSNGTRFLGKLSFYPHSGYSVIPRARRLDFVNELKHLKGSGWLDRSTRAFFIEFVMQNINLNRYMVNTIAFEFTSSGHVLQQFEILYLRAHMYVSRLDHFRLFCEVMFGLLTFYQLWLIQDKLRRKGARYFEKFWSIHLLVSFSVNATTVGLCIYRLLRLLELQPFLKSGVPQGYDLRHIATIDWSIQACFGSVCFLLLVKVISLFTWTRVYRVAGSTIQLAAKHILVLSIGFTIILISFASWGYLAFGSSCFYFHTFWKAMLYTMMIRHWDKGDPDVPQSLQFLLLKSLYVFISLAFVLSFFRAAICACYKDARQCYLSGSKVQRLELSKYLYNKFTLRKKKPAKRVKFSLNPPVRRNTLAMSQQTISLGSDQWLSFHSLTSGSHMSAYYRQQAMNRLTPITDEILHYVHQLEYDEILEDEFYSRLESIASATRSRSIKPRLASSSLRGYGPSIVA